MIAGVSSNEGANYVTGANIKSALGITFLWVEPIPIGFYGPAVLPCLIGFIVTTVETIGDIGATFEASKLEIDTEEYDEGIQGGLLADSFNSFLASLFLSMPNTTFSQNNGVIALVSKILIILLLIKKVGHN